MVEQNLHNESRRGLTLYIKKGIKFNIVELKTKYCEYCCIEVVCCGGELLISYLQEP